MSIINRKSYQKHRLTSIFLLVFLLFSTLGHTHTIDVTKSNIEQPECNLCQHNIGKVPQKIAPQPITIGQFCQPSCQQRAVNTTQTHYLTPQLRAPPVSF